MKTVGIIIAKENSNRFKGKNIFPVNGKPLFWYNVQCLLDAGIKDIYVATDSPVIKQYCIDKNINVIDREINIIYDEQAWFDVIKYCYFNLNKKYDVIVSILANCLNHKSEDILKGLELLEKNNLQEIRSFNKEGVENGIIMLKEKVILTKHEISSYIGSIKTNGKEIHYRDELK